MIGNAALRMLGRNRARLKVKGNSTTRFARGAENGKDRDALAVLVRSSASSPL